MSFVHRKLPLSVSFRVRKVDFPTLVREIKTNLKFYHTSAGKSSFCTQNNTNKVSFGMQRTINIVRITCEKNTLFRIWYVLYYFPSLVKIVLSQSVLRQNNGWIHNCCYLLHEWGKQPFSPLKTHNSCPENSIFAFYRASQMCSPKIPFFFTYYNTILD